MIVIVRVLVIVIAAVRVMMVRVKDRHSDGAMVAAVMKS